MTFEPLDPPYLHRDLLCGGDGGVSFDGGGVMALKLAHHYQPVRTFEEIAQELGVSKQAVQQLEARAMKKLRALIADRHVELRDCEVSSTEPIILHNGAVIPDNGEKTRHTLPPRIHGFEPVKLPPFPEGDK